MANNFNTNTNNEESWITPPEFLIPIGSFDVDPCIPISGMPYETFIPIQYNEKDDGLSKDWVGRVWLNPPYGKKAALWLDKLSKHKGGGIALIFARTDTKWFHESIFKKAHSIFFIEGRIKFLKPDGTTRNNPNAASCYVSYSEYDSHIIKLAQERKDIKGKHVYLKEVL